MKTQTIFLFAFGFVLVAFPLKSQVYSLPEHWFVAGSHPERYVVELDSLQRHEGHASVSIKNKGNSRRGFATLMQSCSADTFLGKVVRLSAWVKTQEVKGWAALWLRVDDQMNRTLAFDNMAKRPIRGSTDWQRYTIVLEVPLEATTLNFGGLLYGKGRMWISHFAFETAAPNEPLSAKALLSSPTNLGFEKVAK